MKWSGRFAGYDAASLRKDITSGLIVGVIAIPLGMAFAIASGVSPEYGIYTTIVAGILISLFGGSRYQIGGPTGAFVPVLLAVILQYGYESLLIAGMMSGAILVLMGLFRLGTLIKYMPKPVITGFTSGIAVIIFAAQIPALLGLDNIEKHESFLRNMMEIGNHLSLVNVYSLSTAAIGFVGVIAAQKWLPRIPGSIMGLLVSALASVLFFPGQVETIGSLYGDIPGTLPSFHLPGFTAERIEQLIMPTLMIALLGGIESLLSAVVADKMTSGRHNSNRELIGQGIANLVTPLFGGIPATGAIARTATNVKAGARSPISGVIHSLTVLLVLLLFAKYASRIPLSSMAPILVLAAWNMSERKTFIRVLKSGMNDAVVLVCTFLLTIFMNLTISVTAGIFLSVAFFLIRKFGPIRTSAEGRISDKSRTLYLRMNDAPPADMSGESILSDKQNAPSARQ